MVFLEEEDYGDVKNDVRRLEEQVRRAQDFVEELPVLEAELAERREALRRAEEREKALYAQAKQTG